MTTIRDVASHAKVSVTTVSHVINGTRYVDPQTELRVRDAIHVLKFRPNSLARSLRRRESSTIGLITPDNSNPFFADVARAIEDSGFNVGYSVFLCNSDGSEKKENAYINVLISKQVDGLILISSRQHVLAFEKLIETNLPVVIVDREVHETARVDQVMVDNEQGGYLAGRYLVERGHHRIVCISGPSNLTPSEGRAAGFRRALSEAGINLAEEATIRGDFRYSGGESAAEEFLRRQLPFTAVFAANDLMAIGAMNVFHRFGKRLPDDISVIGFDNVLQGEMTWPRLTTIAQPIADLGRISIGLLRDRIKQPTITPQRVLLPTLLVERDSVRDLTR